MHIVINSDTIQKFVQLGQESALRMYAGAVFITAGRGYLNKEEFIHKLAGATNTSYKTVYRWLKKLSSMDLLRTKGDMVYVRGKSRVDRDLGSTTRTHIKISDGHIANYKNFKKQCLIQLGLIYQGRFRYHFKEIQNNAKCPMKVERIKYLVSADKSKIGVSLSYMAKKLGISKASVHGYFLTSTKANYEKVLTIPAKHMFSFLKYNEYFRYKYNKVGPNIDIYLRLPSTIKAVKESVLRVCL